MMKQCFISHTLTHYPAFGSLIHNTFYHPHKQKESLPQIKHSFFVESSFKEPFANISTLIMCHKAEVCQTEHIGDGAIRETVGEEVQETAAEDKKGDPSGC
ncbi:hypothetical protein CHARACLAT_031050 [Characodon lateralis]|uniref:Uncharacterized protein n=1 Tax=Characodon lateralis TaxID=208331 RepID=A0ABU7CWT5_9TELE|nr:hypothetical protein [Characodon lateralis]